MTILYDGIGSNPTGEHTEEEFLEIMAKLFTNKKKIGEHKFNEWTLPKDYVFFTLADWLEYSGAVMSESSCN